MRRTALVLGVWALACSPPPTAPAGPTAAPSVAPARSEPNVAPTVDPKLVDVAVRRVRGDQSGHTAALHELLPTASFTIIVHAPATDDARFFQQTSTLDVLFHPHDPAPDVLYVYSSPSRPLSDPEGRFAHQVEAEDARALQARFGDFALLVLDADGRLLGAFSEPAGRSAIQELIGHRDRE